MAAKAEVDFIGKDVSLSRELNKMSSNMEGWANKTKSLVKGALAVFAAREVVGFVSDTIAAFNEQAAAENKLNAVIKATGSAAGFTGEELKKMASDLQQVTLFGDETTIAAQSVLLTFKEVKKEGGVFERAIESAQDMSTLLGTDLQSSTLQLGKALNDPIKGLSVLTRNGVTFTDKQREMVKALQESGDMLSAQNIILNELSGQFGGVASAAVDTYAGKWKQLTNTVGDWMEVIGGVAIDALFSLLDAGVQVVTYFQTAFSNLPRHFEASFALIELAGVRTFNQIGHFLTEVIPGWASWFADNWADVFQSMFDWTGTVLNNAFDNFVEFFQGIWRWLSGEEASFEFKGLTDGFETSLQELPKIAERHKGALEKSLELRAGTLFNEIAEDFNSNLEANRAALGLSSQSTGPGAMGKVNAPGAAAGGGGGGVAAMGKGLSGVANFLNDLVLGANGQAGGSGGSSGGGGFGEGLTDLFSRIQGSSGQERAVAAQEDTAVSTAKSAALNEKIKIAVEDSSIRLGLVVGQLSNGVAGVYTK